MAKKLKKEEPIKKVKKGKKKPIKVDYFCYPIAYIDATFMSKVEEELNRYPEYKEVTAMIPTVKILKKTFKGKQTFEEVPLLFNYGFFKMPRHLAIQHKFLEALKSDISCIYSWVKDPQKVIKKHAIMRDDGKSIYEDKHIPIATATSQEVANLIKDSFNHSAHDATDLGSIYPGAQITLRGYPFDDMPAEVVEIDPKHQEVKVKIQIFNQIKEVMVAFDNVFFTIYHGNNYNADITVKNSLDQMMENKTFDKFQFNKSL